jgi:ubiquinol-cytochrome c reductase cytochrome c1 subunit
MIEQRNASTSSSKQSSWANGATLSASTALAVGSCGFYYFQFGRSVHAMTPAEEG